MLLFLLFSIAAIPSAAHAAGGRADAGHLELGGTNRTSCSERERRALLTIKSDMYGSGYWLSSWKGDDCCSWRGVACDDITGRVTSLDLRYSYRDDADDNMRASKVNPSLLELKHLKHLDLSMNNFAGVLIPEMFVSLVHLEYLNLSSAMFGGPIPPQLGNLSSLYYLDLSNCYCSRHDDNDTCPQLQASDLGWLSHISSLEYLDMSCVDLSRATSWLQQINSIPSLRALHLGNARLPHVSCPLPLFNLTSISVLDLSGCLNLSTTVLTWLSNASSLKYLYLQHCYLGLQMEPLQLTLGSLPHLKALKLSDCSMSGDISGIARNVSRRLKHLDLSSNSLARHIPPSLWELRHLEYLDLFNNTLSGRIPQTLGNLTSLRHLNLAKNEITGEIPETVGNLVRLEFLRLSYNCIIGKIPPVIGNLTNLVYLGMRLNNISGRIPETLSNLIRLEVLDLCNNNISGKIPEALGSLKNMHILALCENSIHGQIPAAIGGLDNLQDLNLWNNHLTGHILTTDGQNIGDFSQFSDVFCNITLRVLDLSGNNFTGNIPECHTSFPTSLQTLLLNDNSLSGPIPPFLKYCTQLGILDLGGNKLSGEVPRWLGSDFSSLRVLRLSSNGFQGMIPLGIGNLTSLQVLDLSSNNFSGGIPPSLGNLRGMIVLQNYYPLIISGFESYASISITTKGLSYYYKISQVTSIDLSNNILSGEIPTELTNLVVLHFLNLSRNHITGSIPQNIGTMRQLESLDLSMNDLTGEIPSSISALSFLSSLNLSHNNLSGRIPTGRQLSTLNDPSIYAGNEGLCGVPLPACPGDTAVVSEQDQEGSSDELEKILDWTGAILGFVIGFWSFIGVMITKDTARAAIFKLTDEACDSTNNFFIIIYFKEVVMSSIFKSR